MTPGGTGEVRRGGGIAGSLGAEDLLLLAAVSALPWFWGGVLIDAYRAAAAVIALAAGWTLVRHGAAGLGLNRRLLWLLPAFLLLAFGLAQTLTIPRAWVARLSPKAASLQASAYGPEGASAADWIRFIEGQARAVVPEASTAAVPASGAFRLAPEAPAPPRGFTLSLQPDATLERAFWYAALLLAFLVVHRRTASARRATAYSRTVLASLVGLAVVGTLNYLTAPQRLLWLRDAPPHSRPFGPYVNPSHFGGAMELAVPWLLGLGLGAFVDRTDSHRRVDRAMLAIAGAAVGAVAALLAASKMAVLTIGVASVLLLAVAVVSTRGRRRRLLLSGAALVAVLLGAIAVSGPLRARIADATATHAGEYSKDTREIAWRAGLRMAGDYPLTGSGFGALAELIPAYLPRGESELWVQLHNDYLEVLVDGGAIAAVLIAWMAAAYAWRLIRALRVDAGRGRVLPTLGLTLGLAALAAHEAVDFNLQVPANALMFVVIAAIAVAPLAREGEAA